MALLKKRRSLRVTVCLSMGILLLAFVLVYFLIIQFTMTRILLNAETKYLEEQSRTAESLFARSMENASSMAEDISIWPDAAFAAEATDAGNPSAFQEFIDSAWADTTLLKSYQFNFFTARKSDGAGGYRNLTGKWDEGGNFIPSELFYDYINDEDYEEVPEGFPEIADRIAAGILSAEFLSGEDLGTSGIFKMDGVFYHFAATHIKESYESDKVYGMVILGSVLSNEYFLDTTKLGNVEFEIVEGKYSAGKTDSGDRIVTSLPYKDYSGKDLSLLIRHDRVIYAAGQRAITTTVVLMAVSVFLLVAVLYVILYRQVFHPIEQLTESIKNIDETGEVDISRFGGSYEFYTLGRTVNEMFDGLKRSNMSLEAFKGVLNGMDAFIYVTDLETDEILFINDKMTEEFGTREELEGAKCWRVLQTGKTGRCEFCPVHRLSGTPDETVNWEEHNTRTGKYYRNNDSLIQWTGGKTVHMQHSVDITDVKRAEETLTKRLQQQEFISAMSQNFISEKPVDRLIGDALELTGRFFKLGKVIIAGFNEDKSALSYQYGWKDESEAVDKLGKASFPFEPGGEFYDAFIKDKLQFLACPDTSKKNRFSYINQFGVKAFVSVPLFNGGEFWGAITFDECIAPREWDEGEKQLMILVANLISSVITRDIIDSERRMMSSIVEASPQYITYLNEENEFEYFNEAVLDITGYTREELTAGGLKILFSPEQYEEEVKLLIRQSAERKQIRELPIVTKSGETKYIMFSVFPISDVDEGHAAIGVDMTEKRRLEEQLVAAKDQAEQSSRAKGDFLSRMSHEMRTPMNAIIGMTNIARDSADPERKDYCLDKIDDASKHLLGVINDILDMSKIEANKFEISNAPFNFEHMIIRVTDIFNFKIDEKHLNFSVVLGKDLPYAINADEQHLSQVITNLLSNAIKFTPDGGDVVLSVKKESEDKDGCVLRFSVKDSGIGISPENQKKLFRSFEQADGSISRKFGGTGLGLVISKSIVELMGGRIWAESEEGKGADFIFTVKVRRAKAPEKLLPDGDVNWKTLRTLVVDDAPEVLEYFGGVAAKVGFACDTAESADAAFKMIEGAAQPYNILFVDWKMPGMNGIEMTRLLRERYGDNTVVIMISSVEWTLIEEDAKAAGVDMFLPKPLFFSQIVDCIVRCMGTDSGEGAEKESEYDFSDKRILIAEDIEINREIVAASLEETGITIDFAENGREAVEKYTAEPEKYDIIFMDVHMPEMDGYEATRRIRASDAATAKTVPIIAMTANVFREDVERCLAAGMNDHIGKPIEFDKMLEKMKHFIR